MKPSFFISSTIFDFKDLRSAIKWWLEENDYKVNASEFNDFDKPLDQNSYESCLRAIDSSDYYILIIGDRFGGMYNDEISITQMEFKYAYERMLNGKIKLINFIRQDTHTKLEQYKQEIKGQSIDISQFTKEKKELHRIHLFVQEVKRIDEMKKGGKPKNNWIHQFNGFTDLLKALNAELGDKIGLNYKSKRFIICQDLIDNLKSLLKIDKEYGLLPKGFISKTHFQDFTIDFDNPIVTLTKPQQINLAIFYVSFWQITEMKVSRLEEYYNEGFFLEYDKTQDDYVSGDFNKLATSVIRYYKVINNLHLKLYSNVNENFAQLSNIPKDKISKVSASLILNAIKFCEAVENCINFSKELYKILHHLNYTIPIHQEDLTIYPEASLAEKSEIPNDDQILNLLTK